MGGVWRGEGGGWCVGACACVRVCVGGCVWVWGFFPIGSCVVGVGRDVRRGCDRSRTGPRLGFPSSKGTDGTRPAEGGAGGQKGDEGQGGAGAGGTDGAREEKTPDWIDRRRADGVDGTTTTTR